MDEDVVTFMPRVEDPVHADPHRLVAGSTDHRSGRNLDHRSGHRYRRHDAGGDDTGSDHSGAMLPVPGSLEPRLSGSNQWRAQDCEHCGLLFPETISDASWKSIAYAITGTLLAYVATRSPWEREADWP
jgi:hypothetical protein